MSRMVKSLLVTVVVGVLIFGAVFGLAASLSISGVDNLGGGSADISSPPDVTGVTYTLVSDDYTKVDEVVITFADTLPVCSDVYVELTDSLDAVITGATGSEHVDPATNTVTVDVGDTAAADICDINITVIENVL